MTDLPDRVVVTLEKDDLGWTCSSKKHVGHGISPDEAFRTWRICVECGDPPKGLVYSLT